MLINAKNDLNLYSKRHFVTIPEFIIKHSKNKISCSKCQQNITSYVDLLFAKIIKLILKKSLYTLYHKTAKKVMYILTGKDISR